MNHKLNGKKIALDVARALMESGEATPAKAREVAAFIGETLYQKVMSGANIWSQGAELLKQAGMPGTAEEWLLKGMEEQKKKDEAGKWSKETLKISWTLEEHEKKERDWLKAFLDNVLKQIGAQIKWEDLEQELELEGVWKGGKWEVICRGAGRAIMNLANKAEWMPYAAAILEYEAWLMESLGICSAKDGWDAVNKKLREDCFKRLERERKANRLSQNFPDRRTVIEVLKRLDARKDLKFSIRWITAFRGAMEGLWENGDEYPCQAMARTALALAEMEIFEIRQEKAISMNTALSTGKVLLPLRTLRTAGFKWQVWCSDWSLKPDDSVESIFDVVHQSALLSKDGRALSVGMDAIRAKGGEIRSSGRKAAGVPGFMDLFEAAAKSVGGHGLRVFLSPWHLDFLDFLDRAAKGGKILRAGVLLSDDFMRAVEKDADWHMFSTADAPNLGKTQGEDLSYWLDQYSKMYKAGAIKGKTVKAKILFRRLCETISVTGDPAVVFTGLLGGMLHKNSGVPDPRLRMSLPCSGEGGVGFAEAGIDVDAPQEIWDMAVRICDNALELDTVSKESATVAKWRPIGLTPLNLFGGAKEGEDMEEKWMQCAEKAMLASRKLGDEKGAAPKISDTLWVKDDPWGEIAKRVEKSRGGGSQSFARIKSTLKGSDSQRNALLLAPSSREEFAWAHEATPGAFPRSGRDEIRWQGRKWTVTLNGIKKWGAKENLEWAGKTQGVIDQGQTLDLWMEGRTTDNVWETLFKAWLIGVPSLRRMVQDRRI